VYVGLKARKLVIWDYATVTQKAATETLTIDPTTQPVTLVFEDDGTHISAYLKEEPGSIVSTDPAGPTPPPLPYTPPNSASTLYGIYIEASDFSHIDALTMDDFKVFF
jgi:hypothetical protein